MSTLALLKTYEQLSGKVALSVRPMSIVHQMFVPYLFVSALLLGWTQQFVKRLDLAPRLVQVLEYSKIIFESNSKQLPFGSGLHTSVDRSTTGGAQQIDFMACFCSG